MFLTDGLGKVWTIILVLFAGVMLWPCGGCCADGGAATVEIGRAEDPPVLEAEVLNQTFKVRGVQVKWYCGKAPGETAIKEDQAPPEGGT